MATGAPGAVFFLGTRAHYQVLQQPETQFDVENGNASSESIYRNTPGHALQQMDNYITGANYCANGTVADDNNIVKRRNKRRSSETALCDDMKPAALNHIDNVTPKSKQSRISLLPFLCSLSRRKKKLHDSQLQYLRHMESTLLTACTYRESCRCLECQSRYFECDEDEEDYSSEDDSEYLHYLAQAMQPPPPPEESDDDDEDEDDEVFVDNVPEDNTSTDLLIEDPKVSVSSTATATEPPDSMNLEVAAGTPVLLNYLLTHPVTCAIQ